MIKLTSISKAGVAASAALFMANAAQAVPIVYDFTGVGQVCGSSCFFGEVYNGNFSGTITIDVLAPNASGDDVYFDAAAGYVSDPNGWVDSSYVINWDEGSFVSNSFPGTGLISSSHPTIVVNGPGSDWLQTSATYEDYAESNYLYWEQAQFSRYTTDTSWLSDNTFRTDVGLATGAGSFNQLFFWTYFADWFGGAAQEVRGTIDVQTLVARPPTTPVPEPSTLALLALGMLGACFVIRRRERIR